MLLFQNYIPTPEEKTFPLNKTFPDMANLSDSFLGESNSEVFPDWNKYQIQVKELQLDLASERGKVTSEYILYFAQKLFL